MLNAPGWYGKLPSTGDFASRRLPHDLIEAWDNWLAEEIGRLREQSEDWLDAYLDSPTWRFVVPADWLVPAQAGVLAGVLMPSVDSVGRYFPLTIMVAMPAAPQHPQALENLLTWLHQLDDLAADAMQEDWSIDTLEEALAQLPAPTDGMSSDWSMRLVQMAAGDIQMIEVPVAETRQGLMSNIGQGLLQWAMAQNHTQTRTLGWWWCEPSSLVQQRQLLASQGLPRAEDFATLLGSNHTRYTTAPPTRAKPAEAVPPVTPQQPESSLETLPPTSFVISSLIPVAGPVTAASLQDLLGDAPADSSTSITDLLSSDPTSADEATVSPITGESSDSETTLPPPSTAAAMANVKESSSDAGDPDRTIPNADSPV